MGDKSDPSVTTFCLAGAWTKIAPGDEPGAVLSHASLSGAGVRLEEVEAVGVHDLGPGGDEVLHELLLGIAGAVGFGQRPQLRVRTENQIRAGASPFHGAGLAILAFEEIVVAAAAAPAKGKGKGKK